jgi:DNA polymerase-1
MKTLYLIDGHAQMFRGFHAIRSPMSSPVTREPTNATFAFVGMLLKLLRQNKPDYLAVVFDVAGDRETFRSELYPEYKATRPPAPQDLPPQIERCERILRALHIPVLGVAGVEADDVLATLATRITKDESGEPLKIRLVSKDKDLQQLLDEGRVEMYDIHTDELFDVARLLDEKKITPTQVIDMLALMGDTVDNVPGVEGVGPKTASDLIAQYGTLDNLLANADEIKGKRGEKIRAAADQLALSRKLVTLVRDVDVDLSLDEARTANIDLPAFLPILAELGFNRYQDEVKQLLGESPAQSAAVAAAPKKPATNQGGLFEDSLFGAPQHEPAPPSTLPRDNYRAITTRKDLDALVKQLRALDECFAIDTETTGLSPLECELCGISVCATPGDAVYIPVRSPDPSQHLDEQTVLAALRPVLEDPAIKKCGHNLKYDLLVLRNAGVELRGVGFDSMVASYLVDPSRSSHKLDFLALDLLKHACIPISDLIGSGKNQRTFDTVPLDIATAYAAEDADVSLRLRTALLPQVREMKLEALMADLETPLVEVLAELEWNGIACDPDELDKQAARLATRIDELRAQIEEHAPRPFNPDSPKQLSEVLFNKPTAESPGLGIKPLKKTKTGYSTDIEVLEKLAADPAVDSPVPALIVEYRQLTKLVSTYLVALKEAINPRTKRIHASFNQTVAATGRLSSSDPNLQNIPIRTDVGREIRRAFYAPQGRSLVSADYSQIELRILAHLSQDPALIDAFKQGQDIHRAVAAQINAVPIDQVTREQRDAAKMVNFGIVYGITAFGLARRLGKDFSNEQAAEIIAQYKQRFAGITTFLEECVAFTERHGYAETMLGRRRPIPQIHSKRPNERSLGERMAINSVVQGSAADLIKLAMLDLHTRLSAHAPHLREAKGMPREPVIPDVMMLLQIHDELVFEAPHDRAEETRALVVDRMESAMQLRVPLKADASIAQNWFEGK